jgi:hypothetical protein
MATIIETINQEGRGELFRFPCDVCNEGTDTIHEIQTEDSGTHWLCPAHLDTLKCPVCGKWLDNGEDHQEHQYQAARATAGWIEPKLFEVTA